MPSSTGPGRVAGWSRPVVLPDDVDDTTIVKAHGIVELPHSVSWSGPRRTWDLDDRRQRAQVYEIVLSEGTDDDVRRYIDVDALLDLWDELLAGAPRPQRLGRPPRPSSWRAVCLLSSLQEDLLRLISALPEAQGFALAGGAAMIVRGTVDRFTGDLDLFGTKPDDIAPLLPAIEAAAAASGMVTSRRWTCRVRSARRDPRDERCEVDLGYDARLWPVQTSRFGPVIADDELAADKTLALFGRAAPRVLHRCPRTGPHPRRRASLGVGRGEGCRLLNCPFR